MILTGPFNMPTINGLDRNAGSLNRTRRNWQRLTATSTTPASIEVSSTGGIVSTSSGYGVLVNPVGGLSTGSPGLGILINPASSTSLSTGAAGLSFLGTTTLTYPDGNPLVASTGSVGDGSVLLFPTGATIADDGGNLYGSTIYVTGDGVSFWNKLWIHSTCWIGAIQVGGLAIAWFENLDDSLALIDPSAAGWTMGLQSVYGDRSR